MNQTVDMFKATKVDIKLIEPEVTYKAGVDVMMMRAPSYWSRSGGSKNRTAEQTEESKEMVTDLIGDPTLDHMDLEQCYIQVTTKESASGDR